jgi:hydroxypyruvate isomerase
MKFSANLGFLWTDRPLPDAIRAAKSAGFDAVERHWPYETPTRETKAALLETGLPMLGLNTRRGDVAQGQNGLAALPGRENEARAAIDEALAYAHDISASAVHVIAGLSSGPRARAAFCENLAYACEATPEGVTILIEPLNHYNAPGYCLTATMYKSWKAMSSGALKRCVRSSATCKSRQRRIAPSRTAANSTTPMYYRDWRPPDGIGASARNTCRSGTRSPIFRG